MSGPAPESDTQSGAGAANQDAKGDSFWKCFFDVERPVIVSAIAAVSLAALILFYNFPNAVNKLFKVFDELVSEDFLTSAASMAMDEAGEIPVLLLHVDNATHEREGRPGVTSRHLLAMAVEAAIEGRARVLLLDIDLSSLDEEVKAETPPEDGSAGRSPTGAARLACLLRRFGDTPCQADAKAASDAVSRAKLPFLLRVDSTGEGDRQTAPAPDRWAYGSPIFPLDPDETVREWFYSGEEVSLAGKTANCSIVELAVLAFRTPPDALADMMEAPAPDRDVCRDQGARVSMAFTFDSADLARGIFTGGTALMDGRQVPSVIAAPISMVDPGNASGRVLPAGFFAGRVVVVGASHDDIRDNVTTPRGQMPGALVIANAINSAPAGIDALDRLWIVILFAITALAIYILAGAVLSPLFAVTADVLALLLLVVVISGWLGSGAIFPFLAASAILAVIWNAMVTLGRLYERFQEQERGSLIFSEDYNKRRKADTASQAAGAETDQPGHGGVKSLLIGLSLGLAALAPDGAEAAEERWMVFDISPVGKQHAVIETPAACADAPLNWQRKIRNLSDLQVTDWIEPGDFIRNDFTQTMTVSFLRNRDVTIESNACEGIEAATGPEGDSTLRKIVSMADEGTTKLFSRKFETLVIPILEGVPVARLPAGTKALDLVWVNGEPPFSVEMRVGQESVSALADLPARHATLTLPAIEQPLATVLLVDRNGETASYLVQTAAQSAPTPAGSGGFRQDLAAAFNLLNDDQGRWRLVALDRLRGLGENNTLAGKLAADLETGEISWEKAGQ